MTSKETYLKELATLHYASVGVIITRTKEEARCLLALEDFAHQHDIAFRFWNCRDGWVQETNGRRVCDGTVDPFSALGMVQDMEGAGAAPLPPGIYAMLDTDFVVSDHPALLRSIKEAARTYCDTGHRLIMVVPPTFSIPETLTHHVSILDFDLPTREEILESYERTVEAVSEVDSPNYTNEEKEVIVNSAIGMTTLEAENIMARAIVKNSGTWPDTPVQDFCRVVMEAKTEIIKRSEVLELHYSLDPASLGGLDLFKAWLQKSRKAFTPEAKQFGVRPPKGTMLVGVPGTGKSIAVRCVAHILGMPLIRLDVSRVFGSLVGETEGKVRAALMMLDAMAPCVAWIDEIDKAGLDPRQAGGDSGTSRRVMGSLLTHMAESTKNIFWVFTANRVDSLPPELLRKGRLEELFNIAPPNSVERAEILSIHITKRNHHPSKVKGLAKVVTESKGYVGAELEAAVNAAVTTAFHEGVPLTGDLILVELRNSVPIKDAFAQDFAAMRRWAEQNARPASSVIESDVEDVPSLPSKPKPSRRRISLDDEV